MAYRRQEKTARIEAAILAVFAREGHPLTARRVYYALTVLGVAPKTDQGYRQTLYALTRMRQAGRLPFSYLADNSRWQIRPRTYEGMHTALETFQEAYRRDLWAQQPVYLEIWVEKDALASVVSSVTAYYQVPLWVARGFSSLSTLHAAAEQIIAQGKPAHIAHLGDYDPSGVLAAQKIGEQLAEFGAPITFERLAITPEQIAEHNLPTRATKPSKHAKFLNWPSDRPSCELDALPTPTLKELVEQWILQFIEAGEWNRQQHIEQLERETLSQAIQHFGASTNFLGAS